VSRVVSDTGPLLHLHEATLLSRLEHAGIIAIPKAVDSEMALHRRDWRARKPQRHDVLRRFRCGDYPKEKPRRVTDRIANASCAG
jgi:hypothetical protein